MSLFSLEEFNQDVMVWSRVWNDPDPDSSSVWSTAEGGAHGIMCWSYNIQVHPSLWSTTCLNSDLEQVQIFFLIYFSIRSRAFRHTVDKQSKQTCAGFLLGLWFPPTAQLAPPLKSCVCRFTMSCPCDLHIHPYIMHLKSSEIWDQHLLHGNLILYLIWSADFIETFWFCCCNK